VGGKRGKRKERDRGAESPFLEELTHVPPLTFLAIKLAEVIAINTSDKLDRDWKKIWKLTSKNLFRACFSQVRFVARVPFCNFFSEIESGELSENSFLLY
jgi:hypothetical protein